MTARPLARCLLLAALALFTACPQEIAPPDDVAKDLAGWLKQVKEWEPDEKRIFETIVEVQKSQYVEDDFVARTLKDALPVVANHRRRVAAYQPATRELEPVVRQYRKGWEDVEVSFHAVIAACEAKDYVRLAKAKSQMEFARGEILGAFATLDELLEVNDMQLRALREREQRAADEKAASAGGAPPATPAAEGD